MKTRPEQKTRVNFVPGDSVLAERIRAHSERRSSVTLLISETIIPEVGVDIYVIPAAQVSEVLGSSGGEDLFLPVIAHGPPQQLAFAYTSGCVDYLKQPWDFEELCFRVQQIVQQLEPRFVFCGGVLRFAGREVIHSSGQVTLSYQESRILKLLLLNRGTAVTREALFYTLWGRLPAGESRVIDVHVSSIRRKLRDSLSMDRSTDVICSARGVGYIIY